ncbi:MAG TPA: response regulator, partial [Calditrichaeota bacterium]|nr:response regulator [Calditrichota bacterium]
MITAGNAEKGYQLYKENSPQIILTDLMMPGVSGIEYLDLIRSEDQTTEIIIITGYGTMETAIEALRRQASDFLTKPIDFEALNQVMRRALIHLYRKHKITENYSILEKQTHEIASYQKRVEKMVYNVPVAFITYDTEGRILRWNKEAERITG